MKILNNLVSAGISSFESPCSGYIESPLSLDDLLIQSPNSTYFAKAQGLSMIQVGIYPDDLLVIDTSLTPKHMDIIIANLNGCLCCKILDVKNRKLLSANDDQSAVFIDESDTFSVEGVVINSIRSHWKAAF
ncbi:S24 family peptidase [Shewanella sp. SG44-6]|jgi:DNA polymerase V|uniref:S24 family peptidase n=1 Tax=Shewanella sp. SG44-6 TaxID=2760959 RepID=UPI001602026D|nr:S24 family peptidase [Shewanella sp. SG44-6]MBB1389819.1 S24 family peptidase [Shewanella sp. SG44-6]